MEEDSDSVGDTGQALRGQKMIPITNIQVVLNEGEHNNEAEEVCRDVRIEAERLFYIGSVYKILAKVLATRLGQVMGKLISSNQSAFIKGRLLVDGVLALNEVVDFVKRARKKCLIFKVDFEKAYDSVNWNFL
ncbi:transposon TX1 putative protein, partial [Trifolium medium]|nr:transposon TX1 putative protein [Trifolium medium]